MVVFPVALTRFTPLVFVSSSSSSPGHMPDHGPDIHLIAPRYSDIVGGLHVVMPMCAPLPNTTICDSL